MNWYETFILGTAISRVVETGVRAWAYKQLLKAIDEQDKRLHDAEMESIDVLRAAVELKKPKLVKRTGEALSAVKRERQKIDAFKPGVAGQVVQALPSDLGRSHSPDPGRPEKS